MKLLSARAPAVQTLQTSTRLFPITRTWWVKSYGLLSAPRLSPVISSRNWEDAEPNIRRCSTAINQIPQQNGILAWERGEENSGIITDDRWLMSNCQDTPERSQGWVSHPVSPPPTELMRLWKIAGYQCPAAKKDLDTMRLFLFFKTLKNKAKHRICSFILSIFSSGCFRRPWGGTGH